MRISLVAMYVKLLVIIPLSIEESEDETKKIKVGFLILNKRLLI